MQKFLRLNKFKKQNLNISEIMDSASLLKYNSLFKNFIENQFKNPTDDFIKLFLQPVYKGAKTQSVIEKFRPIVEKALTDYINELLTDKIQQLLTLLLPVQMYQLPIYKQTNIGIFFLKSKMS